jgi:hypothetical protein
VTKDKSVKGEMLRDTVVKRRPGEIRRNKSIGREELYVGKT